LETSGFEGIKYGLCVGLGKDVREEGEDEGV
jgi:hypothetical protein